MQEAIEKAETLIEALKYIQAFRDRIVVIKLGGAALAGPEAWRSVLADVVFMEQVRMMPLVVHGGGPFINAAMHRAKMEPRFVGGLRYTDEATLGIVRSTLIERVNTPLVKGIEQLGGRAVGVHPGVGRRLVAHRHVGRDADGRRLDLGFVGQMESVDRDWFAATCRSGSVPVVAPLAVDGDGVVLNVNADSVAAWVAMELKAAKLVYVSDTHGVMEVPGDNSSVFSTLTENRVRNLVTEGVITGGMIPKVTSALQVLDAGVGKVHIIDGRIKHSLLLEIFTDAGVGTEIVHEDKTVAEAPLG